MINQTIKYTLGASALVSAVMFAFSKEFAALALLVGTLWGSINLYLISKIAKSVLITKKPLQTLLLVLLKFPLLYGVGYVILKTDIWDPWLILAGLTLSLLGALVGPLIKIARRTA